MQRINKGRLILQTEYGERRKKRENVEQGKIEQFKEAVAQCNSIVFFGGAGVSTESGIPDFRSTDGLYNQKYKYPPETIVSHSFYMQRTEEFYEFYKDKMLFPLGTAKCCAQRSLQS